MSELIQKNDNRATIRWKLLTGASALALTACISSANVAKAEDTDRPVLWLELGGQMEQLQGAFSPFIAPFMSPTPEPDFYKGFPFVSSQRGPRFAFGEEGKISFQPEDSNWIFSAGIRYGRAHSNQHSHRQLAVPLTYTRFISLYGYRYHSTVGRVADFGDLLADTQVKSSERHVILDFTAGKDVGLGLFGRQGSSTINAGVRFASFNANSAAAISGRPAINAHVAYRAKYYGLIRSDYAIGSFHRYALSAQAARSFKGIGPTLSWNASAALAGNNEDGELTFDWGISAALLFGKQKAKTNHTTVGYHHSYAGYNGDNYVQTYSSPHHSTRSRSVTVPNIGGYAGLSVKYTDVKVSIGYRYDTFLKAMDTGIDARKTSNITFNGPYASISIGLGD